MSEPTTDSDLTVVYGAEELVVGPDDETGVVVYEDAAFAAVGGEVVATGPTDEVLAEYPAEDAETAIDATGKTVLPGFVDPHTHAVFAGDRSDEFVAKLKGATYEEILADGGGILRTVDAVREASDEELAANLTEHLDAMLEHGTTTVEVKTGYGLDTETELRLLEAIATAGGEHPVDVIPTFMGAHAVPRDVDTEEYTESVISEQLPAVAEQGVAEFCDVFCERGVFTADQSRRILEAGKEYGLTPKIHADEFADIGGTDVAAAVGAASADHLLQTDADGRETLVGADVTPVVLPGTAFGLGAEYADARAFLDAGHEVALATDFNPNCFARSMAFIATLGSVGMRMTPQEVIRGITSAAANALDRDDGTGTLQPGSPADAVVLDIPSARHLSYRFDTNPVSTVLKSGVVVHE
ncbi:imidazolonepropionase (plasmid) [Haloferax mediterranei ATCC 33500]|uniref:Imidazolonepropionase n=1 Tax=Haloferax mediterranei (strain ATCC 33500 / DSM 1411 / JCM 8866 / NBRC 14739 / NCIMB 2177 / R-4) TaxID=523841 RepID=I3RB42_HALMT|nr:imidazolonepropionase [Haloferax mediterranei]AFK21452.1 imidazolonepropionase [Haloferax mediterranei ATCC 33500]AHZ24480.1 imidazolonepropionase [Haloferax mediterranei ATCC 33500]ELZ97230.1 imidazolonepropionase [Haloferax mediterranei ATCC 33500]MDX5990033.1 imidazolonepropionase [Haloferax mediterranei ATCC 33500]QCQ76879.1 imidazolonepropionase [Haloferax mediterranei ATCC 33500]